MIAQFHRGRHATARWTLAAAGCLLILAALGLTDRVRGQASPANKAATKPTAGATTQPSQLGEAQLKEVLTALMKEAHAPSADEVRKARTNLADKIRNVLLIINANGQPINTGEVDEVVKAQTEHFDRLVAEWQQNAKRDKGALADIRPAGPDEEKLRALLQKRLPEVKFDAIGFSDVIDFFRDVTGANITVNWRAFEAAGIDRNTPCTMRLRDVTFEQALTHLMNDVGGGTIKLAYAVSDGSIVISTSEELANHLELRTYVVTDLLQEQDKGSAQPLASVILQQVSESQNMIVTPYHDRLLIKATPLQQREVESLLAELRKKPEAATK